MFERRLKLLLILLVGILVLLGVRAAQFQLVERSVWADRARTSMKRQEFTETARGTILDVKGRAIATDVACIDACIDYRAVQEPPDEKWVRERARARLVGHTDGLTRSERIARLAAEEEAVRADIAGMWDLLGELDARTGGDRSRVSEERVRIRQTVERRRRSVWMRSYELAMARHEKSERPPWYKRFVMGDGSDVPQYASYEVQVGEELQAHPVLRNISAEVSNYLEKNSARLPGLVVRRSRVRYYPFGEAGAHLLGYLTKVNRDDLERDTSTDELREYTPQDLIGRSGLESLLEPELRGRRGVRVRIAGSAEVVEEIAPVGGKDVQTTIDINLQGKIQELFHTGTGGHPMHGAAVVIDVPTGEVRALASYPAFDPNTLDVDMHKLLDDELNEPLRNRATLTAREPGSTVKPLVGLAAITAGVLRLDEAIECRGYLVINGKQQTNGRCWTMSREPHTDHMHLAYPPTSPFLQYPDAIQRSCNVFFETCGDRLGIDGMALWMDKFGLGRPTGIGVPEAKGLIPSKDAIPVSERQSTAWFAGIGQSKVNATPLQIANVIATIARDGIWVRPHLVPEGTPLAGFTPTGPERVDLGLNPEALRLAKIGMTRVVNTPAGSGFKYMRRSDMVVAGKTGTAQAALIALPVRDPSGNLLRDTGGNVVREKLQLSTEANPNPAAPWYLGTGKSGVDRAHAWFVGFAPAEKPKIAFAVLVEYGGSGGPAAGPIAKAVVQSCIDAGYLSPADAISPAPEGPAGPATPSGPATPPEPEAVGMLP